jgi:hypothetical protein
VINLESNFKAESPLYLQAMFVFSPYKKQSYPNVLMKKYLFQKSRPVGMDHMLGTTSSKHKNSMNQRLKKKNKKNDEKKPKQIDLTERKITPN